MMSEKEVAEAVADLKRDLKIVADDLDRMASREGVPDRRGEMGAMYHATADAIARLLRIHHATAHFTGHPVSPRVSDNVLRQLDEAAAEARTWPSWMKIRRR